MIRVENISTERPLPTASSVAQPVGDGVFFSRRRRRLQS